MFFNSFAIITVASLQLFLSAANPLAEALAAALPKPLAEALAKAESASYGCHANCGYSILAARKCAEDGESDTGPYDLDCLCADDSQFNQLMVDCLDCAWCLYDDYWPFLTVAISECSTIPTTPTGTTCLPSSLATVDATGSESSAETTASDSSAEATEESSETVTITATSGGFSNSTATSVVSTQSNYNSTISRSSSSGITSASSGSSGSSESSESSESSGSSTVEDSEEASATESESASSSTSSSGSGSNAIRTGLVGTLLMTVFSVLFM
ncbi:uncharacterized protein ASCRUDRAFT_81678 [Ascoidea rubescens DSM 1968]|uniref:Extracellular membrane protein CFEM domain-containing protein n=1 Tax=Ascoidea rubescens DSM 1968 TaxID=1344418 RepID=A0A1D2VDI7_9ASCO|nr:hypothetical protein ASCRUDRAFT_81678 [Ascoidea rubescens DSM 1968]ODV59768.1 hypothetical protein ASCRUDRAFT_81678 [Ascoidea rubescens DSM 1968]